MEIALKLEGNSQLLVLYIYNPNKDNWEEKIWIEEKENGKKLRTSTKEILLDRSAKKVDNKHNIFAESSDGLIKFYEKYTPSSIFEMYPWHTFLSIGNNIFSIEYVHSGSKGIIIPVKNNGIPCGVFASSNLMIAGKRKVSLYITDLKNIDELLLLYLLSFLTSSDSLEVDMFKISYFTMFAFSGRKELTPTHLDMLPEERKPTKKEELLWYLLGVGLLILIGLLKWEYIVFFIGIILIYESYIIIRNLWEKK